MICKLYINPQSRCARLFAVFSRCYTLVVKGMVIVSIVMTFTDFYPCDLTVRGLLVG